MSPLLRTSLRLWLLSMTCCASRPPFVVVSVEDPDGVATGFAALYVGTGRQNLAPVSLDSRALPLSITVTAPDGSARELWVEARDAAGTSLGRGRTTAAFERDGMPTVTVRLGRACASDSECSNGRFCDGAETCSPDGTCMAGTAPCTAAVSCLIASCIEHGDGTGQCSISVDHSLCPIGTFCNATFGCALGQRCLTDAECQDGSACNGAEVCAAYHCIA